VSEGKPQLRKGSRAERVKLHFFLRCKIAWKYALLGHSLGVFAGAVLKDFQLLYHG